MTAERSVSSVPHSETATERGDRIERERVDAVRPIIRRQAELMLGLAGTIARDAASGISSQVGYVQAVRSGLNRDLAEWVRRGCKP